MASSRTESPLESTGGSTVKIWLTDSINVEFRAEMQDDGIHLFHKVRLDDSGAHIPIFLTSEVKMPRRIHGDAHRSVHSSTIVPWSSGDGESLANDESRNGNYEDDVPDIDDADDHDFDEDDSDEDDFEDDFEDDDFDDGSVFDEPTIVAEDEASLAASQGLSHVFRTMTLAQRSPDSHSPRVGRAALNSPAQDYMLPPHQPRGPRPRQTPRVVYTVAQYSSEDDPSGEAKTCPICMETGVLHSMGCGHFFHLECINEWVRSTSQNSSSCPVCRASF